MSYLCLNILVIVFLISCLLVMQWPNIWKKGFLNACSSYLGSPKIAKIPALDAGYHPISLQHLHPTWNVLLPARGDEDR